MSQCHDEYEVGQYPLPPVERVISDQCHDEYDEPESDDQGVDGDVAC